MTPRELTDHWRSKALVFREHEQASVAIAYELCAEDLEDAFRSIEEERLTLAEAAETSGYSADHLGRLIREGKLPNAGRKGSPRIMRGELPMKPGVVATGGPKAELGIEQIVRSVIDEGVG